MKKPNPGQMIQIVANIGVIAGIVFLGFELRQNNQFLGAEARIQPPTEQASCSSDGHTG